MEVVKLREDILALCESLEHFEYPGEEVAVKDQIKDVLK